MWGFILEGILTDRFCVPLLCQELSTQRSTLNLKGQLLKGEEPVPVRIHALECVFEDGKAEEEE